MSTSNFANSITDFASRFSGVLLQPTDAAYHEVRRVHNGLIDKKPRLIARCLGTSDISEAVKFARAQQLVVSARGGGHNVAGRAAVDDGLMIDLSLMKSIYVDPKERTARAQGGATWADFNRETQVHGLATTGGVVSTTGIGGLTLGGGLGWIMGKHGLAVDNLLAVELVTADGSILQVSADDHSDLFWGLRGGGGNFGIASSLKYRLHPVGPMVTGGLVAHTFDNARDVLRFFRETTATLPDEMVLFAGLIHAPDGSGTKLAGLVTCHCGDLASGEAAARPVKSFGKPVMDVIGPMPYSAVNGMLDAAYPKGALNYWKSNFLQTLSDAAIDTMIDAFAKCPTPMGQILLEHFHGAATRVGVTDTAIPHRSEGYNFLTLAEWMDPRTSTKCIQWARDTYESMEPFMAAGRYVNYLNDDEQGDPVAAAYGPNYEKLRRLKAKYDPENFFRMNQNILPISRTAAG
jgi:FAD/FMN-containing dehydrogenase